MGRIAEPVDRLIEEAETATFDVVVVGSGYGGSVAARRCAEAGLSVAVVERGREYLPGDFPRDSAAAPGHFRIDGGGETTGGYDDALYDLHLGDETMIVSGNGLGGGSLINAGVALAPDRRVFEQPAWPKAIRDNVDCLLARCERVRHELAATPYGKHGSTDTTPDKTIAFESFARKAAREAEFASITVNSSSKPTTLPGGELQPCIGCGDCVSGCNYGAKATLGMTYLAEAHKQGARLFTNVSVMRLKRLAKAWRVWFTRTTDQRSYQRAIARLAALDDGPERSELQSLVCGLLFEVEVPVVIVSAGSLGSTEILQRSRATGLSLSHTLGTRFSGNGDYLSFGYHQKQPVHAVGWGGRRNQLQPGRHVVGPTITRVARFHDEESIDRSFVVEDAAIPGALGIIFHELVTNAAILHQLERWTFKGEDALARTTEGAEHTQVFLAMGHDGSRGELRLASNGRTQVHWPTLDADAAFAHYDEKISAVGELGAVYLPNPAWTPIPRSMESVLSGERFRGRSVIVHPLGGCPMGDDGSTGVVDDIGAVYMTSSDRRTHPGLYVLDGAIVPTSLGANPLLTIAALAERAVPSVIDYARTVIAHRRRPSERWSPPVAVPVLAVRDDSAVPLTLHEVLRGELVGVRGRSSFPLGAKLEVTFPTPDLGKFLADPMHRFDKALARLQLSPIGDRPRLLDTWHYGTTQGLVTILEPVAHSLPCRVLDTLQVLATWFIERGANEGRTVITATITGWIKSLWCRLRGQRPTHRLRGRDGTIVRSDKPGIARRVLDILRLAWHAADRRRMRYEFTLPRIDAPGRPLNPEGVRPPSLIKICGRKDVYYAASCGSIAIYALRWLATLPGHLLRAGTRLATLGRAGTAAPARPRLHRRNVWQTLTELDVRLLDSTPAGNVPFAAGRLAIAGVEMLDEHPPRIHGETTAGILGMAGYPLLFARYLLKCRILDFRLPDYRPMPKFEYERAAARGAALRVHVEQRLPLLRDRQGTPTLAPECHELDVPRRENSPERIGLVLWRYRNKVRFTNTHDGMTQCRSILLVHAFAQSAICFAEPTQKVNLAEALHREGWDVWLVEHRISIGLPSATQQCTMDEIASFDLPAAVRHCLGEISRENPGAADRPHLPLQMFALAQCVGSAALAMAILGGYLQASSGHASQAGAFERHVGYEPPYRSLLAGVALSQFTPFLIGDAKSQFRTFLPTLLRDFFRTTEVHFDAPADPAYHGGTCDGDAAQEMRLGQTDTLLDRVLATLPRAAAEHCWDEHQGHAASQVHASCRRMAGVEAPLFSHEQLAPETHDRLPLLLGVSNLGVFLHARKCVERERLVNADGLNVYVTAANIQRNLHMPVAFVHGRRNALFAVGSSRRSYLMLGNVFPKKHMRRRVRLIIFEKYGHLDWLIGKRAHEETHPRVTDFFHAAWKMNMPPAATSRSRPPDRHRPLFDLVVPAMGPIVGHVTRAGDEVVANIWMRPEQHATFPPQFVVVAFSVQGATCLTVARLQGEYIALSDKDVRRHRGAGAPQVAVLHERYAVVKVCIPWEAIPHSGVLDLEVLSLHPAPGWKKRLSRNTSGGFLEKGGVVLAIPDLGDAAIARAENPLAGTFAGSSQSAANPDTTGPHEDLAHAWKELLKEWDEDNQCTRFEAARCDLMRSIERTNARIDRTVRTTLSRVRLRKVDLRDAHCSISRTFVETAYPKTRGVELAATCCRYPGFLAERHRVDATYGRILETPLPPPGFSRDSKAGAPPAALFLVGDQIYADATAGLFDLSTPIEKFEDRYTGWLQAPPARELLASVPAYMAVDDHEISDDWDRSQGILDPLLVEMATGMARVHQWSHSSIAGHAADGLRKKSEPAGMVHECLVGGVIPTLVLDTRSLRRARNGAPAILPKCAWERLLRWLDVHRETDAPKLIVTGSPIAPGFACHLDEDGVLDPASAATADNWQAFDRERTRLFDAIREHGIRHVVLLSGDYHCGAVAQVRHGDTCVATAVIAPPSYAPLAYANRAAADIALTETSNGYTTTLVDAYRDAMHFPCRIDGSGHVRLRFTQRDGHWRLHIRFDVADVCLGADMEDPAAWRQVLTEVDL